MVALLAAVILAQPGPVARADKFLSSSKSFAIDYTVTSPVMPGAGTGHAAVARPNLQHFSIDWAGESFEFIHNETGGLSIRHDTHTYYESPVVWANFAPPPTLTKIGGEAAPSIAYYESLEKFAAGATYKVTGKESVRGVSCDVVQTTSMSASDPGTHTFWVGPSGKILRWKKVVGSGNEGSYSVTFEITKFDAVEFDAARFRLTLPVGYVPAQIPGPRYFAVAVPGPAPLGQWLDARSNKRTDVAAAYKKSPFAIVFTDPDSDICARMEPYLLTLRRRLKQEGCALVEVVLGGKKPDLTKKDRDRAVFWDDKGEIERAYGPAGTPTIFLVDKDGKLVTGWQGYSKDREDQITQTLLDGLKDG